MVYVNYGSTQITDYIRTSQTDTPKTVAISATYGGTTWTATLEVLPAILASATLPGQPVRRGDPLSGTYVLSGRPVPGRQRVNYPSPAGRGGVYLGGTLSYTTTVPATA